MYLLQITQYKTNQVMKNTSYIICLHHFREYFNEFETLKFSIT